MQVIRLDATRPTIFEDLALDEALLVAAEERGGPAVLRFWEPPRYAVVLGASGRVAQEVEAGAIREDGVALARRSSGGGTVVVGPGALNVAVVLPVGASPELRAVDAAQGYVLGRIARAIRAEGMPAEVLGSGDLTLGGRKFSGSAQRRLRRNVLVHATILRDFPLGLIDRYCRMPPRRPAYRLDRPHADFVVNLPVPRDRLVAAIAAEWGAEPPADPAGLIPEDLVAGLAASKFSDRCWIERL